MSIAAFKASLYGGGARPNQFRVFLTFPSLVNAGAYANLSQFLCTAASLPAAQLGVAPVYYHGRLVPLAGDRSFNPWAVTIINDTNFGLRNAMEDWVNIMASVEGNTGVTSHLLYTSDATVEQLDRNGAVLKRYVFKHFFPQMVSEIPLGMSQNDQVEEFQVQFAYEHWEAESTGLINTSINIGGVGIPGPSI
jgi:hypothetical protein